MHYKFITFCVFRVELLLKILSEFELISRFIYLLETHMSYLEIIYSKNSTRIFGETFNFSQQVNYHYKTNIRMLMRKILTVKLENLKSKI